MKIPLPPKEPLQNVLYRGFWDNHTKFLSDGGGDPSKAKEYNNCIADPFFNIPLSQVHGDSHKSHLHCTYL